MVDGIDWSKWRSIYVEMHPSQWTDASAKYFDLFMSADEATYNSWMRVCPIGVLNAELSLFSLSLSRGDRDHAAGYRDYASLKLRALPLRVLIGSRWPLFALLTSRRLRWYAPALGSPDLTNDTVINCEHLEEPALNWHGYLDAFRPDAVKDWYNATIRYVMSWQMTQIPQELYKECPLGFITTMLIKAITCATTESSCFDSFAGKAERFLKSSPHMLDLLAHSRWPLSTLLNFLATTARHQYFLDFTEDELSGNLSPLILSQSTTFVAAMGTWLGSLHKESSQSFRDLAAVLPKLGPAWEEAPNLVYITMIYGAKFNRYMRRFCARARSVGLVGERLLIFTLDQEAFELCLVENGQRCIRGTPSIMNKFTLPLMCAHLGLDTVWIDLDVFLMVDPTPALLEHAERGPYDLLVSGSFEADCICNGIVYFRSTRVVVDWLLSVLVWMYHHPYEHDQKTFSAFLNYTERVSKDDLDLPQIPAWDTLDPINQFVTPDTFEGNGWTGDLENIVIYHFLNGESDTAGGTGLDPSGTWMRQFGHFTDAGGAAPGKCEGESCRSGKVSLMDLFYGQEEELYTTAMPAYENEAIRNALLSARKAERSTKLLGRPCGPMVGWDWKNEAAAKLSPELVEAKLQKAREQTATIQLHAAADADEAS